MSIPRTRIYHKVGFDLINLVRAFRGSKPDEDKNQECTIEKFEQTFADYLGLKYGIAFPFTRTALYFALRSKQFKVGSQIIMPPITIKPMMDVVLALGLKPVFVDIDLNSLCFDLGMLAEKINSKTKAVLITYLFGNVPDIRQIISICRQNGLFVIEDFSHNLNAKFMDKKLGTFGDIGIYSCSITKTLDAYGGGLAVTNDNDMFRALKEARGTLKPPPARRLRAKILKNVIWNLATQRLLFTLVIYPTIRMLRVFSPVLEQKMTGVRLNLKPDKVLPDFYFEYFTSLQAKVGLAMLRKVEADDNKRIANVEKIKQTLTGYGRFYPETGPESQCVYWQFVIYPKDKEKTRIMLSKKGIDSGTTNLSLISGLGIYPEYEKNCPNAEYVKYNGLFIPAYPGLSESDLKRITSALRETLMQE